MKIKKYAVVLALFAAALFLPPLISNAQESAGKQKPSVDTKQTANIEEQKAKETENAEKLRKAAHDGDIKTVSDLLQAGADPNIKDEYGNIALMKAARKGHKEIVEILKKAGAKE